MTFVRAGEESEAVSLAPGDSSAQQAAEHEMTSLLGAELGMPMAPRRMTAPDGAYAEVDAVSIDGSILAECWAHQGPAKVAQKYKLMNDASKLRWIASWAEPVPRRLLVCVSDERAVKHLRGTSWRRSAIGAMDVEIVVVGLDASTVSDLEAAQERQYR